VSVVFALFELQSKGQDDIDKQETESERDRRIVLHVFGEMGNIHALNPFTAAVCSSSDSVMSQPTENSDERVYRNSMK
jgi:hypothetical protein